MSRPVYRQPKPIDEPEQELRVLRQQMQAAMPAEPRALRDEIPPHY